MTGIVKEVKGIKLTHCHITATTNEVFFAHRSDFLNPASMVKGAEVEFRVKLTWHGRFRAAADITAIQRQAA